MDKDIEIVKEFLSKFADYMVVTKISTKSLNKLENSISNVLSELETYKKITEKLASKLNEAYFEKNDFWLFFEKEILKGIKADYGYVGDVIIDWARKEVE